jgi:DNA-binding CsgD family transcriptional regulator
MDRTSVLTKIPKPETAAAAPDICDQLLAYSTLVGSLETPEAVLDELHAITSPSLKLNMLGAARLPSNVSLWEDLRPGKSVFLHKDAPRGWWDEWYQLAPRRNPAGYFVARMSLVPHTWSEMLRALDPIGSDRWGYELAMKYGMRDGLTCAVGGRWIVCFWSPRVITKVLTEPLRVMMFAASSFAAMRLEQVVEPLPARPGGYARLTPRELAVIRPLSMGKSPKEIAEALGLGEETVRTHFKNAQAKLQANNRTHAIAEALRQHLIL